MSRVLLTADDAGASAEVNDRIEEACDRGFVNSVSFLTNTEAFPDAVTRFAARGELRRSVHLNVVEGRPLALTAASPLVDGDGYFKYQAANLLIAHLRASSTVRSAIERDIQTEWKAQIERFLTEFGAKQPLNIDSHQHVHVAPFALGPLVSAVRELKVRVNELRLPRETVLPRVTAHTLRRGYLSMNVLKYLLLRRQSARGLSRLAAGCDDIFVDRDPVRRFTTSFSGVLCTGFMTADTCKRFAAKAPYLGSSAGFSEILVHPGGGQSPTDAWRHTRALDAFYRSPWRSIEMETACDPMWADVLGQPRDSTSTME